MALTSVATFIKPDELRRKIKGQKIKGISMSYTWNGDVLYSGLTETVMCHMWCDTCVSRVVWHWCVVCGVTLVCQCGVTLVCHMWCDTSVSVWCDTGVSYVVWHWCVSVVWHWYVICCVTLVCHVWCDTGVSCVMYHFCVTCGVTLSKNSVKPYLF
jgi:hypothetical protein